MKKLCVFAIAAASVLAASADVPAEFVVYNNGTVGPNIETQGWHKAALDAKTANPDGQGEVYSFAAADKGTDASMGMLYSGDITTGPFWNATLSFSWFATTEATYAIRLTAIGGREQDYVMNVTADDINKWNECTLSVADAFPNVSADWKEFKGGGTGFIFAVVLTNGKEDSKFYFNNVKYTGLDQTWEKPYVPELPAPATVPVPETPSDDVFSLFCSSYNQGVGFNIGGWGQTTLATLVDIDGKQVYKLENFNYLGWEFASHVDLSGYNYLHVDYWTPDGTTFGFTPIFGDGEKGWVAPEVKKEEWNSYDVPMSYFGKNAADVFQIKFDQGTGNTGYIANVYFYKKAEEPVEPVQPGATYNGTVEGSVDQQMNPDEPAVTYPYTLDYAITYNEDKTLTIKAKYDWKNGQPVGLVEGAANVNGVDNNFTMENGVRTTTTAATFEPHAVVTVKFNANMALGTVSDTVEYTVGSEKEAEEKPENPDYKPGNEFVYTQSKSITVNDKDYGYDAKCNVVWNADKTLTFTLTMEWADNDVPVGLVDGNVYVDNKMNAFAQADGIRTATTTDTYEAGQTVSVGIDLPMAGYALNIPFSYTVGKAGEATGVSVTGADNAEVEYYTLQGVRVTNPDAGIHIRKQGRTVSKIVIR